MIKIIFHGIIVLKRTSLFIWLLKTLENGDYLVFPGSSFNGYRNKLCSKGLIRAIATI